MHIKRSYISTPAKYWNISMKESLVVLLLVGVETEGTLYTVQICLQNIDFITNKQFDQLATCTKYAIIGTFCSLILCIKRARLKTTVVLLKTNNTWLST